MTTVAALLVTKDAERWLPALLASLATQTRPPDQLVVVDDHSADATRELLAAAGAHVVTATSSARDRVTRIAQNFVQGARVCAGVDVAAAAGIAAADVVVLGDHDDVWHADRIEHQVAVLTARPRALMLCSDGRLVDDGGAPVGGTLRTSFPLPAGWPKMSAAQRMAAALRRSVATGGASAIRPAAFADLDVPPGWLHDRWWSLVALARDGLVVDDAAVIDYRVQPGQQVGLDRAAQDAGGPLGRAGALVRDARRSARKVRDVRTRLRPLAADPQIAAAIRVRNTL